MYNYWSYLPTWASYPAHYFGYHTPIADHKERRRHKFSGNLFVLLILLLAPAGFLGIWGALNLKTIIESVSFFGALPLGGDLTYAQAKAIDFGSSAFASQIFLEVLNYYWFGSARVAAPAAHPSKDSETSLHSLIAASNTSHGNYEIPKLFSLLRSRTGRITTLAWLSLTAAFAKTAFSNLISFEANADGRDDVQVPIRLLADPIVQAQPAQNFPNNTLLDPVTGAGPYQFDLNQTATLAEQITSLLTQFSVQNSSSAGLTSNLYQLQYNLTSSSLDAVGINVTELDNVPAFNATINCKTDFVPNDVTILDSVSDLGQPFFLIRVADNTTQVNYTGSVSGPVSLLTENNTQTPLIPFLAFNDEETGFYIGFTFPLQTNNQVYNPNTSFGQINPVPFNAGSNPLSVWGLNCELTRRFGNVTLLADFGDIASPWFIDSSNDQNVFKGDFINSGRLIAKDFQISLNYQSPATGIAGIGAAIGASANPCVLTPQAPHLNCGSRPFDTIDYDALVTNTLNALLGIEQIALNIAGDISIKVRAPNNTALQQAVQFDVSGKQISTLYNIVYVPILLLFGLIAMIASSAIVVIMSIHSKQTLAAKEFRKVDSLRLLVDAMAGLKDEFAQSEWEELRQFSTEDLEDWAKEFRVAYSHVYTATDAYGAPLGQKTVLVPRGHGPKRRRRHDKYEELDDEGMEFR